MPLPRLSLLVAAIVSLAPLHNAHAQLRAGPRPASRVSFDLALGGGIVRHDAFATANGIQAEALLAGRLLSRPGGSLVVAATGFKMAVGFGDDLECRVPVGTTFQPGTPTICYGRVHLEPTAALLGGGELRRYGAALRVLAGPIRYRTDVGQRTGTHMRLDLAVPASGRLAFVLASRMSYLGRIRGEAMEIFGMSAGVRLQR